MALINPKTGSTKFNVTIRRKAVISLAGETPTILSEDENFTLKLVSDAISGEEITSADLQEVPDDEIDANGIWVKAAAAQLKSMSQEELIQMVLAMQAQTGVELPVIESVATETEVPAEEVPAEEEAPKPRKKRKKPAEAAPAPAEEVVEEVPGEEDEEEVDVEF